ncbi:hypothetical protein PRIPAC_95327 [Pristionchus pacificus]|uniref:Chromo domain-containing protein n=1 Tax=Pristionchus pacificus TaxID=54126 RepID=A0A454Y2G1_PRIPA|nr:hypothetical protein PRIPAC_95327 [Pristionchus pacificus]|eukprot:PDM84366.1 hypothetical protein PRIPAC_33389 [Pristionchus pacificus]
MSNKATLFGNPNCYLISAKNCVNGHDVYDVQKFLKIRLTVEGDAEFLVKWVGFKTPTWEPRNNLDTSAPMYQEFLRKEISSGKTPRVYTPRSSKGSTKNPSDKASTPKQLKAQREMEEALSEDQYEQEEEDVEDEQEDEEEEEEVEEIARRCQKRQRSVEDDEEDEEEGDEVEKKIARVDQENNNRASMCWFL